jgi:hypothetical protein
MVKPAGPAFAKDYFPPPPPAVKDFSPTVSSGTLK